MNGKDYLLSNRLNGATVNPEEPRESRLWTENKAQKTEKKAKRDDFTGFCLILSGFPGYEPDETAEMTPNP